MTRDPDRDRSIDSMLRRTLAARDGAETASPCLDAETLAAWVDEALSPGEVASVEAHAAGCARCQAMLAAMAKTTPPPVAPERSWRRRLIPFLVPLTAATALVIWLAIPRTELSRFEDLQQAPAPSAARDRELAEPVAESVTPAERRERAEVSRRLDAKVDERKKETDTAKRAEQTQPQMLDRAAEAPAAAAPSTPPLPSQRAGAPALGAPAAPPQRIEERVSAVAASPDRHAQFRTGATLSETVVMPSGFEIRSPDPLRRWRVVAGRVERSTDGGSTWIAQDRGSAAAVTAGASPSPDVCWLVGRAGTVLLTTDGRRWQRLRFPEVVDLVAIRATDAATATVVTADGRSYTTKDAGLTWNPAPLQEFPEAPF